jgi:hypothetical protein
MCKAQKALKGLKDCEQIPIDFLTHKKSAAAEADRMDKEQTTQIASNATQEEVSNTDSIISVSVTQFYLTQFVSGNSTRGRSRVCSAACTYTYSRASGEEAEGGHKEAETDRLSTGTLEDTIGRVVHPSSIHPAPTTTITTTPTPTHPSHPTAMHTMHQAKFDAGMELDQDQTAKLSKRCYLFSLS